MMLQKRALVGDDGIAELVLCELRLVFDARAAKSGHEEIEYNAVCVFVQGRAVNREADASLDKLRRALCRDALRPLHVIASAHVRRGRFGVQARLQRVDLRKKHVE